jgi:hypothetical protein
MVENGHQSMKRGGMRPHRNPDTEMLRASFYDELLIEPDQWSKVRLNHRHAQQAYTG